MSRLFPTARLTASFNVNFREFSASCAWSGATEHKSKIAKPAANAALGRIRPVRFALRRSFIFPYPLFQGLTHGNLILTRKCSSFIPQGFRRLQFGGSLRRQVAKKDSHRAGNQKRENH